MAYPINHTATAAVASGADDGQQLGTTVTLNGTACTADIDATNEYVAARMQIPVGQGETVNSATLYLYFVSTFYDELYHTIYFEASDNSPALVATSNNISARTHATEITAGPVDSFGAGYYGIDITEIVQELVDRPGWVADNYATIIVRGKSGSYDLRINFYDLGAEYAPKIDLDWDVIDPDLFVVSANTSDTNKSEQASTGAISASAYQMTGTGYSRMAFLFTIPDMPQGTTIVSADFVITCGYTVGSGYFAHDLYFEAADSAAALSTSAYDISSRSLGTGLSVTQAASPSVENTIDVTTPLQELINRAGWSAGNNACLILHYPTGGIFEIFTGYFGSRYGGELTIVTTGLGGGGGGGISIPVVLHHLRQQGIA